MANFSTWARAFQPAGGARWRSGALRTTALAAALLAVAGCAVEFDNRQAAHDMARAAQPQGQVYLGWRVFQDKCLGCHGPGATGTARGPDLLPRLREMGSRQFVGLVLKRYDWGLPAVPISSTAASGALVEDIVQRRDAARSMPAWQGEPSVNAHIMDLYAYLSARAQGTQGPGRPPQ